MNEDRKKRGIKNHKILMTVAICALFLGSSNTFAARSTSHENHGVTEQMQSVAVNVLVVDAQGEPIIGANVVEKGTTNGGITDINGKIRMNVKAGALLQISFVGYTTQEIKATPNLRVVLKDDTELLDEVVVVGYGSQKKENLTGAVASVNVNQTLEGRPIADIGRGLQGTTPGLSIQVPSGEVGSDPIIKIRGQIGSIEGEATPLILLDNVEIPSIQMVNPDDIESISVLKDAASASIYGAKAAFGVVLITTKKGAKSDRVNVSYQGNLLFPKHGKRDENGTVQCFGIQRRSNEALRKNSHRRYFILYDRIRIGACPRMAKQIWRQVRSRRPLCIWARLVCGCQWTKYRSENFRPV